MLLERSAGLAEKINNYNRLLAAAKEARQYETRANQVQGAAQAVVDLHKKIAALREAGVSVAFVPVDGASLEERARIFREGLAKDPTIVQEPPFDLKNQFIDRLNGLAQGADRAMLAAWQAFVDERVTPYSDDILNALYAVPQFRPSVERMRAIGAQLNAMRNVIPSDVVGANQRLTQLGGVLSAAWAEITTDDIPQDVIRFLRACSGAGAPLSSLTESVHSWFKDKNLLGVFRVRI